MRSILLASSFAACATAQFLGAPDKIGEWSDGEEVASAEFDANIQHDAMIEQVVTDMMNLEKVNLGRSATNATRATAAALHRFIDLKKLVSWMQPIDKRISRYCFYGCWCLPEGAHGFTAGTGKPVDLVDKSCYQLWQCYECARDAFNNNGYICSPDRRKYSRRFFYSTSNPNDYSQRGITCTNPFSQPNTGQRQKLNCARAVCECDKAFAMRLYKYHSFWSRSRHRIWSGHHPGGTFIVADECKFCSGANCGGSLTDHESVCCGNFEYGSRIPHRNHGGLMECCNEGPSGGFPWYGTMYNTLTSCCQNGRIPPDNICNPLGSGSGVLSAQCNSKVMDVLFLLDGTASVSDTDFSKQIAFVVDVITDFDWKNDATGVRVGAMTWGDFTSNNAVINFDFEGHQTHVIDGLNAIAHSKGASKINIPLQYAADSLGNGALSFRSGVHTVAIVFIDNPSIDTTSNAANLRAAKGAGETDVHMIAIGVDTGTNAIGNGQLNNLATDPDVDNALRSTGSWSGLQDIKDALGLAACSF